MKKLLFILCLLCLIPSAVFAKEVSDVQVYVKGRQIATFESFSGIEMKGNRVYLPVRTIAEALDYDVNYIDKERAVVLKKGEKVVKMSIGQLDYKVGDMKKHMDVSPYLSKNRTYLPMRFVAEALGEKVVWDGKNRVALFSEMPIRKNVKGEVIRLADGVSFVIPEALKDKVLFKEDIDGTRQVKKRLYEKKNYEKTQSGWLGTFNVVEKPESEVITFVVRRLDQGYLVFSCPSDVQYDSNSQALTAAYKEAYGHLEEVLSTIQVGKEKVSDF